MTRSGGAHQEQGTALISAIMFIFMLSGLLAVISTTLNTQLDRSRRERARTASTYWADSAINLLQQDFRAHRINQATGFIPRGCLLGPAPPAGQMRSVTCGVREITISDGKAGSETEKRGSFRVMAFRQLYRDVSLSPTQRNGVQYRVRAWPSDTVADSNVAQDIIVTFTSQPLSMYQLLVDDPIELAAGFRLEGAVHTNAQNHSTSGDWVSGTSIDAGAANVSGSSWQLSSSRGQINHPSCTPERCREATNEVVDFGGIQRSVKAATRLAFLGADGAVAPGCVDTKLVCHIQQVPSYTPPQLPLVRVRLTGNTVSWSSAVLPGRAGSVPGGGAGSTQPFVDDQQAPIASSGPSGSWVIPPHGGVLLLPANAEVVGFTTRPLTIMATPRNDTGEPANIYLPSNVGGNDWAPLGLVADGYVYVPTYAFQNGSAPTNFTKVAIAAQTGSLRLGPIMENEGAQLSACQAAARFGSAPSLRIHGSVASRSAPGLAYTSGGCTMGYQNRNYTFDESLIYFPPPLFPTNVDWQVRDWYCLHSADTSASCGAS